jgi:hypothetical protein
MAYFFAQAVKILYQLRPNYFCAKLYHTAGEVGSYVFKRIDIYRH